MSEERSIYDFGSGGISMLNQEIVKRDAEIAQLRQRAELAEALALTLQAQRDQAEAGAAALRDALEQRHTCENCGGKGSYWTDVGGEAEHEVCDCWIEADDVLKQEHPGAQLLVELDTARAIVTTLRMHRDAGGEVWHSIDADLAAYDAAKARTE